MRNFNRTSNGDDDGIGGIVILVGAIFGFLIFPALRALFSASTRDYRPAAYDTPHSRPIAVDYAEALGLSRLLLSLVFVFILSIGVVLLTAALNGTLYGQRLLALALVTALTLLGVLLTLLTTQRTVPFAFGALILFVLATLFGVLIPRTQTSLVPLLLCGALVSAGIALLQVATPDGREGEVLRAWNESALWLLLVVTLSAIYGLPLIFILFGALLALMLLGGALASVRAFDLRRLLVLLALLLVVIGVIAYWLHPNTLVGVGALALGFVLLIVENVLGRHPMNRPSVIADALVTNPMLLVSAEPTLVILPDKSAYTPEVATKLIEELLKSSDRLSLSVVADGGEGITWQVSAPAHAVLLTELESHIHSHQPACETVVADPPEPLIAPIWRQLLLFGMVNDYAAPLPFAEYLTDHDPLAILSQRMSTLHEGEHIRYQVTITTATDEGKIRAINRLRRGKIHPLAALWQDPKRPLAGFDEELITTKLESPLYHCFVCMTVESPNRDRLELLNQAERDIEQFYLPGHNRLVVISRTHAYEPAVQELAGQSDMRRLLEAWKQERSTTWREMLCVLSPAEIAALWHLPSEDYQSQAIAWAHGHLPEDVFHPVDAVPLGETTAPGMRSRTVYLKARDRAAHHYIAGMTNTGKSTLMLRLIQADILAGHGVAVIDPQGKLVQDVLNTCIPSNRIDDVVLLECRRTDYPVPINPFRIPSGMTIAEASTYVLFALQKIYEPIWLLGQTENYIESMVQLLLTDKEATPIDIARVFQDDAYRKTLLERLSTQDGHDVASYSLQQVWELYGKKSAGEKEKILSPIVNRTRVFTTRNVMELMTCHPDSLDFRELIAQKKIVLIDLSGNNIFKDVDNLATLFLSGFFLGSYSLRASESEEPLFYLYVDEIERTATAPLGEILKEARKFGLAAILANQVLDDMKENVLNAVLGNVGITSVFQLGIKDARFLASRFEPELTSADLANLDLHRVAVKMRLGEKNLPAVVLKTALPQPIKDSASIDVLRERVKRRSLPADKVRAWLHARYGRSNGKPPESPPPPKDTPPGGEVVDVEP